MQTNIFSLQRLKYVSTENRTSREVCAKNSEENDKSDIHEEDERITEMVKDSLVESTSLNMISSDLLASRFNVSCEYNDVYSLTHYKIQRLDKSSLDNYQKLADLCYSNVTVKLKSNVNQPIIGGTLASSIETGGDESIKFDVFSDSGQAGRKDDLKSSICDINIREIVLWRAEAQKLVICNDYFEIVRFKTMKTEVNNANDFVVYLLNARSSKFVMNVFVDDRSAIAKLEQVVIRLRLKHDDIGYHMLGRLIEEQVVNMDWLNFGSLLNHNQAQAFGSDVALVTFQSLFQQEEC